MSKPQSVPFEITLQVRDACLCLHLQRAARMVARRFDDALRPLGLTNGQFSLMMSLNRPNAPPLGSVAALLGMDRTTVTAMLKPLQRRGLVNVAASDEDRRGRLLSLTREGRELLADAYPVWQRTHGMLEEMCDADRLRGELLALSEERGRPARS